MEYDWWYVEEFSGYEDGCDEQYYDEDEEQYEWEPQEHFEVRSDTDYEGEELQESCPPEALAHCSCRPGLDSDSSGRLRSESSHGSTSDWETDDGSAASHGGSHSSESDPCDCKSDGSCTCNDKEPSVSSSSSSWETTSTCSCACCSAVAYAVRLTHIPARWDRPAQPTNKLMRSHQFSRKVVGDGGRPSATRSTVRQLSATRSSTTEKVRHEPPKGLAKAEPTITARATKRGRLRWTQLRRKAKSANAVKSDGIPAPSGRTQRRLVMGTSRSKGRRNY